MLRKKQVPISNCTTNFNMATPIDSHHIYCAI